MVENSSPVPPALITQDIYDHFMPCAYIVILTAKPDDSSVTRNQIRVMTFNVPQLLTQVSFLQKIKYCKMFFDNCNAEMAKSLSSLQKSEFLKLITLIFK